MFNVTVRYVHDEWIANIDGKDSSFFGTGDSADEAVGDLVIAFQATFGIRINNVSGRLNPLDGMAAANAIEPLTPAECALQVAAAIARFNWEVP